MRGRVRVSLHVLLRRTPDAGVPEGGTLSRIFDHRGELDGLSDLVSHRRGAEGVGTPGGAHHVGMDLSHGLSPPDVRLTMEHGVCHTSAGHGASAISLLEVMYIAESGDDWSMRCCSESSAAA